MADLKLMSWNVHECINSVTREQFDLNDQLAVADIFFLQEMPEVRNRDFYDFYHSFWFLEPSVKYRGSMMGLGVISRFPIKNIVKLEFDNPGWIYRDDKKILKAHPKGALVMDIDHPERPLKVACLHLLPAHIFRIDEASLPAISYLNKVVEKMQKSVSNIDVIAGDFNSSVRERVFSVLGLSSLTSGISTRTSGESHDDIMISSSLRCESLYIEPSFSDHHKVMATIKINGYEDRNYK